MIFQKKFFCPVVLHQIDLNFKRSKLQPMIFRKPLQGSLFAAIEAFTGSRILPHIMRGSNTCINHFILSIYIYIYIYASYGSCNPQNVHSAWYNLNKRFRGVFDTFHGNRSFMRTQFCCPGFIGSACRRTWELHAVIMR